MACELCGREASSRYLCEPDTTRLAKRLAELPTLYAEVAEWLVPRRAGWGDIIATKGAGRPHRRGRPPAARRRAGGALAPPRRATARRPGRRLPVAGHGTRLGRRPLPGRRGPGPQGPHSGGTGPGDRRRPDHGAQGRRPVHRRHRRPGHRVRGGHHPPCGRVTAGVPDVPLRLRGPAGPVAAAALPAGRGVTGTPSVTHPVVHNPLCDTVVGMEAIPWRERLRQEDELLEQLAAQTQAALRRRAFALKDGANDLGSVYAVAAELGLSWTAVARAIKKHTTE